MGRFPVLLPSGRDVFPRKASSARFPKVKGMVPWNRCSPEKPELSLVPGALRVPGGWAECPLPGLCLAAAEGCSFAETWWQTLLFSSPKNRPPSNPSSRICPCRNGTSKV